ncbi:Metallo-dependent phosphatase [Rhizoclosmatium globosum]|uniref:Metallo-dependent phosphatase n=1 Tax=Rhizoclosmatium globosum TaxID=329046 RepID=A0A1Y2CVC7_9FUNG|nr:Metallo-dependent phosphatase [Rhizoclosmatium globosum]|eukprot:ORY51010.1 Metallo-dependent phosphatase [Rhizoclosmatium globosum]
MKTFVFFFLVAFATAAPRRIIAVGDIHGDFPQAHKVLRMSNLLNETLHWTGTPETTFVQVGDVVDRGPDTIRLFELFQRIYNESITSCVPHSTVYPLLGNHEIMNLSGDLRSVSQADFDSFGGRENREKAWRLDGWIGQLLTHTLSNVTVMVDGTVFVHGGIQPKWAKLGIDGLNLHVKKALLEQRWDDPIFARGDTPFWYRGYANGTESVVCEELNEALEILGAKRMVIGHTPQLETGEILSRCGGKAFVIDVGITSRYGANCAALEIIGDSVTALYCVDGKPDEARRVDMSPRSHTHSDL